MPVPIASFVERADRALSKLEAQQFAEIDKYLRQAQKDLEAGLKQGYNRVLSEIETKSEAWKQARARLLNSEIESYYQAFDLKAQGVGEDQIRTAITEARSQSVQNASDLLDKFEAGLGQKLLSTGTGINLEAVHREVRDAATRLYRYSGDTIETMKQSVVSSIVQGESVAKATRRLRQSTGLLRYQAERIVRTETLQAHDRGLRDSYKRVGVQYVQRIAVMDSRTCEFCAARAGNVYPVDEAPAALHPNDRCYNVPWRQEWQDMGLTDEEWMKQHHEETVKKLKGPDGKGPDPNHGQAPFEKMNDLKIPKAVWTPSDGYTAFGKDVLAPKVSVVKPISVKPKYDTPLPAAKAEKLGPLTKTAYLKKHKAQWADVINADGVLAEHVKSYTQSSEINSYLRKGTKIPEKLHGQYQSLEKLTSEHTLGDSVTLYRAALIDQAEIPNIIKKMPGTIIEDQGFMSTSLKSSQVKQFVADLQGKDPQGKITVFYKIKASPGVRGAYIDAATAHPGQEEVLLARGTKLRVTKSRYAWAKDFNDNPVRVVYLDMEVAEQAGKEVVLAPKATNVVAAAAKDFTTVQAGDLTLPTTSVGGATNLEESKLAWFDFDQASAIKAWQRGEDLTKFRTTGGELLTPAQIKETKYWGQILTENSFDHSEDKMLYRGFVMPSKEALFAKYKEGEDIMFNTLTAGTPSKTLAKVYADPQYAGGEGVPVRLMIWDDDGIRGLRLSSMETIMAPGSKYRVTEIAWDEENQVWSVFAKKPYGKAATQAEVEKYDKVLLQLQKGFITQTEAATVKAEEFTSLAQKMKAEFNQQQTVYKQAQEADWGLQDRLSNHAKDMLDARFPNDVEQAAIEKGLSDYTSVHYHEINDLLRKYDATGPILDELRPQIAAIDDFLSQVTVGEDLTLFRGTRVFPEDLPPSGNLQAMVGTILEDTGYTSASLDIQQAIKFTKEGGRRRRVLLKIETPASTHGSFIQRWSSHPSENEVLFPRGTKFRIKSVEETKRSYRGETIDLIEMTVEPVETEPETLASIASKVKNR